MGHVDINPRNTDELDIKDGDTLILSSCRGQMESPAKLGYSVTPGSLFRPINFGENPTNMLTNAEAFDPLAKILEFKVSAVNIARLSE
jgi:anaerobic selenocysteine-containing dehydrogenase